MARTQRSSIPIPVPAPVTASSTSSSLSPPLEVEEPTAAPAKLSTRKRGAADSAASTPNKRVRHAVSKDPVVEAQSAWKDEAQVSPPATKRGRGRKVEEGLGSPKSSGKKGKGSKKGEGQKGSVEVKGKGKEEEKTPSKQRKRGAANCAIKAENEEEDVNGVQHGDGSNIEQDSTTPPSKKRSKTSKKAKVTPSSATTATKTNTTKTKTKAERGDIPNNLPDASDEEKPPTTTATTKKPRRPRKTADQKAAEAMPLAPRTPSLPHYIGAHVSAAGGVPNALTNALHIGGNALALFLKSQRKWENLPLKPEHATGWIGGCAEHGYQPRKHVLPHGSYLVNLATADPTKREQAYASFLDDLQRCERLGIGLYNLHPGNTNGAPRPDAIARLAGQLNRAHAATASVVTLLENMATPATGNTLGGRFEDLRDVIALIDDKARVGVCFDTCHAFAAGYDLRSHEAFQRTFDEFDAVVGPEYLRAVHVNDSKGVLGSHRDLHQNLGVGFLGLRAFHNLMNDQRFWGLPLVLETPIDAGRDAEGREVEDKGIWAGEIKLLEGLVGMDVEGAEFERLEGELAAKGVGERRRMMEQFERKEAEKAKGAGKGKGKGKKGRKGAESDEDSEGR